MNKKELEQKRNELQTARDTLIGIKQSLESEMSQINRTIKGRRLPDKQYRELCDRQTEIIRQKSDAESRIAGLNGQIRHLHTEITYPKVDVGIAAPAGNNIPELVSLRDHYLAFASDKSRVSSMRQMAAEFSQKLTSIIRKSISGNHD